MTSVLRRFCMLFGVAATTIAMMASPAIAASYHPDLPYDDAEADNWTGVGIGVNTWKNPYDPCVGQAGCKFSSGSQTWNWKDPGQQMACTGSLAGAVSYDGSVSISNATLSSGCLRQFQGSFSEWTGEICKHTATGTYWSRQNMKVTGSVVPTTFGRFGGDEIDVGAEVSTISPTILRFGDPQMSEFTTLGKYTVFGFSSYGLHSVVLPLWAHGQIAMGGNPEASCDWAELS